MRISEAWVRWVQDIGPLGFVSCWLGELLKDGLIQVPSESSRGFGVEYSEV